MLQPVCYWLLFYCLICLWCFSSVLLLWAVIQFCFWQPWKLLFLDHDSLDGFMWKWLPRSLSHRCLLVCLFFYTGVSDDNVLMPQTRGSGQREWVYYLPLVDISLSWTWWAHGGRSPGLIVWGEERLALSGMRNPKTTSMSSHMRCSATYSGQYSTPTPHH